MLREHDNKQIGMEFVGIEELFSKDHLLRKLRIKSFYRTSINAVKSQIWVALSLYLLVVIAKKKLNLP